MIDLALIAGGILLISALGASVLVDLIPKEWIADEEGDE